MTKRQFTIFCRGVFSVTVVVMFLQAIAILMMLCMFLYDMPKYKEVAMFLGLSISISLFLMGAKVELFNGEDVELGMWGNSGINHSLGMNGFWWCGYFFYELFGVTVAISLFLKAL